MKGRVALFHGPGKAFELAEVPIPAPKGGQILVRIHRCAICRSDVHTYAGRRRVKTPTVLGHEIVGTIEAVEGAGSARDMRGRPLCAGDRVTWTLYASCGQCFFCSHNLTQKCERLVKYGHAPWTAANPFQGGFADFILLEPGTSVLRVPASISDEIAAPLNCAVATAAAVVSRQPGSDYLRDATVLVFGGGYIGLCACAMARSLGASRLILCERNPHLYERAKAFGADAVVVDDIQILKKTVTDMTAGRGVDLVFELAGSREAVSKGLSLLRTGGKIVLAGTVFPTPAISVNPEDLVRRCLRIEGVHNYGASDLEAALRFVDGPGKTLPFQQLLGSAFPLAEIENAFQTAHSQAGLRVSVVP